MLKHPFRAIGAALALAGALTAIVVLVLPGAAIGGRPSGPDEVRSYTNPQGDRIGKVGEDADFNIVGKNLNLTVEVFCFAGKEADDGTGITGWDTLTFWDNGPTSKSLVEGDMDSDCDGNNGVGLKSAVMVEFEHGVIADPSDDVFVVGPPIFVKDEQKP